MKFTGITTIWADTPEDIRAEFTQEFNRMVDEEGIEGAHIFYFCKYKDYKLYTEQLTAHIYQDTVLFYLYGGSMVMELDEQMQVTSGDMFPMNHLVLSALNDKESTIERVGEVCTVDGHAFDVMSLKYPKPLQRAYQIYDNEDYYLSGLDVDEEELIDITLLMLATKVEEWQSEVESSVKTDTASVNMNDNPFANRFYDRAEGLQMRQDKIRIGDREV